MQQDYPSVVELFKIFKTSSHQMKVVMTDYLTLSVSTVLLQEKLGSTMQFSVADF